MVVIAALLRRVRGVVGKIAERIDAALRTATRPVSLVGGLLRDLTRSPEELLAENTALRQQLIVVTDREHLRRAYREASLAARASTREELAELDHLAHEALDD